ncbi:MAG: hypothetical protein QW559_03500 [Candidatus Woesearchaeota archaeon]
MQGETTFVAVNFVLAEAIVLVGENILLKPSVRGGTTKSATLELEGESVKLKEPVLFDEQLVMFEDLIEAICNSTLPSCESECTKEC